MRGPTRKLTSKRAGITGRSTREENVTISAVDRLRLSTLLNYIFGVFEAKLSSSPSPMMSTFPGKDVRSFLPKF